MDNVHIAICDIYENVVFRYAAPVVPRKGELIHLTHRGTFRIIEVAYRLADDTTFPDEQLLMFVEVIVDFNKPIHEIG